MNWKLETEAGNDFHQVTAQALKTSAQEGMTVEFEFNGVQCLANADTDPLLLFRDYLNAWIMEWKTVGPDCASEYAPEVQAVLDQKTKEKEERDAIRMAKYDEQCRIEKEKILERVTGVELELADQSGFENAKGINNDPYGACIFEFAEMWAKLMQSEMASGKTLTECAGPTSFELGYLGITGFMYGAAVSILAATWKHGEALRKWHNKDYGHEGNGVVNPAILAVSV